MASTVFYFIVIISCVNACIKMVPPDMEGMPVTDMPVTDEPVTNEPVTNEPVTDQPATDEPVTDEPVTDEPVTDEPVTDEPVTDEPVTDEPVTDEPVTDEPPTDEPVTDAPITDAPVDCTTCEIDSVLSGADVSGDYQYLPLPSRVTTDSSSGCKVLTVNCDERPDSLMIVKLPNGNRGYLATPNNFECLENQTWKHVANDWVVTSIWCAN